ncbi:MAG TPA: GDP-mannose 4,6-dehydratase, partial [Agriterribacter sp.]|nr:GDP-mannose 4,6-dehydratase [Agriterribacter sp.]
ITTRVREFVRMAFAEAGIEIDFKGRDEHEVGVVRSCINPQYQLETGREVVVVDPKYYRPTEVDLLIGDASKAHAKLGWKPTYDLPALVKEMVAADIECFKKEKLLKDSGFTVKNQFE